VTPEETVAAALEQLEETTTARVRDVAQRALASGVTAAALAAVARTVVELVRAAVRAALRLGAGIAEAAARAARRRPRRARRRGRAPAVRVPARLARTVPVERDVQAAVGRAAEDLRPAGPEERRRVADRAVRRLEGVAATAVNQAAAAGAVEAGRQLAADGVMWVAERDGCLHCQALSGHVMPVGRRFPASVTFGDKPLKWAGFTGLPPRHPRCRCRPRPVWGDVRAASSALQREARRSVVRGFSLPSESSAARLRAAERLLRRGAGLPRSVEAYGRDAVRVGRFPRGRMVPGGVGRRP